MKNQIKEIKDKLFPILNQNRSNQKIKSFETFEKTLNLFISNANLSNQKGAKALSYNVQQI